MSNLLYKELKLTLNPSIYIFPALGALLLIPSYPYFVAFIYTFVSFITLFVSGRENKDVFFTAILPVRKRDTVRARVYNIAIIELVQIFIAVPFAIIGNILIHPEGNTAGLDANAAFFGFVFAMYGLFNIVFLPMFYKTAYKVAWPLAISCTAVVIYIGAVEVAVQVVGALKTSLDTLAGSPMVQSAVLAAGIVLYVLFTVLAYRSAAKKFEKVDL